MTLLNPVILWDVGFQLSFAATLGLTLYLGPWSHSFHNLIQPLTGDSIARTSSRLYCSTRRMIESSSWSALLCVARLLKW